jgi:hypothetical protein
MNSQQLILERIAAAVEATGLTLICDAQYANTGTLRALDADLNQIASVEYDFQERYCHFGQMSNYVAALWYGQSAEGKASYVCGSIPELVNTVVNHFTTGGSTT